MGRGGWWGPSCLEGTPVPQRLCFAPPQHLHPLAVLDAKDVTDGGLRGPGGNDLPVQVLQEEAAEALHSAAEGTLLVRLDLRPKREGGGFTRATGGQTEFGAT